MNFVALSIAADSAAPQRLPGWPYFDSSVTGTSVTESTGKVLDNGCHAPARAPAPTRSTEPVLPGIGRRILRTSVVVIAGVMV